MSIYAKKTLKFALRFLTIITVVASIVIALPGPAEAVSVTPSLNPAWPSKCGLNIGLVFDRSDSISSSEGTQMKTAAKGFVNVLSGTPSQFAVASFGDVATQNLALTSVTNSAGATTVKNSIDGLVIGNTNQGTNWEAGLYTQSSIAVDVVVFLTDGNPTLRNLDGSGGTGYSDDFDFNIDAGITRANALKAQGKRIVAVGIGDDLSTNNLKAVSGPTVNDDYFTSSFDTLGTKLEELATKICGGTITVQKQVKNNDGSYTNTNGWEYAATNAVASPKTTANNGTAEFKYESTPKTTTITETLKPGYSVESATCSKGGQTIASSTTTSVTVTVGVNDIISCVFKNKPNTATLKINKTTTGGNAIFAFTSTVPGHSNFNIATNSGSGTTGEFSIPAGTQLEVNESAVAGWSLSGLNCTGTNATINGSKATFTAATDAKVVCTYSNTRDTGSLTITKNVTAAGGVTDGSFDFTSTVPSHLTFNLATANGTKSTTFSGVPTGTYDVNELVPANWSLTSLDCSGNSAVINGSKATVNITKGAAITCTYVNKRNTATLTVKKNVTAAGGVTDGTFNFLSNTPFGNFGLTTSSGSATTTTKTIPTGTYSVAETVPTGWSLTGLSCSGVNETVNGPSVSFSVNTGDNVVCSFTNKRDTAHLTVVKNVTAAGGVTDGTFNFTSNTLYGNFLLTTTGGTAQTQTIEMPTGSYDLAEVVPAGWSLANPSCTGATVVVANPKITISAVAGANIVCTFTNTRDTATLTIVKNVTAAGGVSNGTFGFTSTVPGHSTFNLATTNGTKSTTFTNVPTGTYDVTEAIPAGWSLTNLSCTGATPITANAKLTVTLAGGANVVCTYTNKRDTAHLTVVKNVTAAGGVTDGTFSFTSNTPLNNFDLTTVNGTKSTSNVVIPTGSYDIAETPAAGWSLSGATCTNANTAVTGSKVSLSAVAGANIVCTFTNTRDTATLTIVKNVTAAGGVSNGTFGFTSTVPGHSTFNLATTNGTKSTTFTNVPTGTYDVTEAIPAGWSLTNLVCSQGSNPTVAGSKVTITLAKDADVTCTYTNKRETATLTVVENTFGGDATFGFASNIPTGDFDLTTLGGTATTPTVELPTGDYDISQNTLAGWTFESLTCVGTNSKVTGSAATLELAAGDSATCTFVNNKIPDVLGTVVTRPDVQVKGISVNSGLPVTGSNTRTDLLGAISILVLGGLLFAFSRKRKNA